MRHVISPPQHIRCLILEIFSVLIERDDWLFLHLKIFISNLSLDRVVVLLQKKDTESFKLIIE